MLKCGSDPPNAGYLRAMCMCVDFSFLLCYIVYTDCSCVYMHVVRKKRGLTLYAVKDIHVLCDVRLCQMVVFSCSYWTMAAFVDCLCLLLLGSPIEEMVP